MPDEERLWGWGFEEDIVEKAWGPEVGVVVYGVEDVFRVLRGVEVGKRVVWLRW